MKIDAQGGDRFSNLLSHLSGIHPTDDLNSDSEFKNKRGSWNGYNDPNLYRMF